MVNIKQPNQFPLQSPVLRKDSIAQLSIEEQNDQSFSIKRSLKRSASNKKLTTSLALFAILMVIIWPMIESTIAPLQIFEFSSDSMFSQAVTNILAFGPLMSLIVQVKAYDYQVVTCATQEGIKIDCSQKDDKTLVKCTNQEGITEPCVQNRMYDEGQVDKCTTQDGDSDVDCAQAAQKSIWINDTGETVTSEDENLGDHSANQDDESRFLQDDDDDYYDEEDDEDSYEDNSDPYSCDFKVFYDGTVTHYDIDSNVIECADATEDHTTECLDENEQVVDCPEDWSVYWPTLCYDDWSDVVNCDGSDYTVVIYMNCKTIDTNEIVNCPDYVPDYPNRAYGNVKITCSDYNEEDQDSDQDHSTTDWYCSSDCCEYKQNCENKQDPVFLNDWQITHYNQNYIEISCEESDYTTNFDCYSYQYDNNVECPDFNLTPYESYRTTCRNRNNQILDCADPSQINYHTVLHSCLARIEDDNGTHEEQVPCNLVDLELTEVCVSVNPHADDYHTDQYDPEYHDGHYMPFCPWDINFDPEWSICDLCDVDEASYDQSLFVSPDVQDAGQFKCECSDIFNTINSARFVDGILDGAYVKFQTYEFSLAHGCDDKNNYNSVLDYIYSCVYEKSGFAEPFQTNPVEMTVEFNNFQNLPEAECKDETHCYASTKWDDVRDPCLMYYENNVCARCKFGAVRIITEKGVFCGEVDQEDQYENELSVEVLRCNLSSYYQDFFDPEVDLTFEMNNRYQNHTNNVIEKFCVQTDNFLGTQDNCASNDQFIDDTQWAEFSDIGKEWLKISIGCRECQQYTYLKATYIPQAGIYGIFCESYDKAAEEDQVENHICWDGEILQWVGLIPSELELECQVCSELIPNCLSCDSASNCVMCKGGFSRSEIIDSFGNKNVVCVFDFCGFYGEGSGCNGKVNLEGCERSESFKVEVNKQTEIVESCIRCAPGYHQVTNDNLVIQLSSEVYRCQPSVNKLTLTYFVAPFDSIGTLEDQTKFDYDKSSNKGKSITDPIYSIQQVLSNFQESSNNSGVIDITSYKEAVVTLYLFKGVHHYINCQDFDKIGSSVIEDSIGDLILLCFNYGEQINCVTTTEWDEAAYADVEVTRCDDVYEESIRTNMPNLVSTPYASDNLSLHIVSMDCSYVDTQLIGFTGQDLVAFEKYCIDVENGEKAQIRIANEYTYFNITNFAEFKDIEFTGEDLFASATYQGEEMGYMGDKGILAFMPFTKCTVKEDAEKLSTIDDLFIKKANHVSINDFDYECTDGFQKNLNEPPKEKDNRCFPDEYQPAPNSDSCSGEPYHEDFFTLSQTNNYFTKRHKVLFNLYSFDSLRTINTSSPELKITNCRFKFFVDKTDALIQVENNNLGYLGPQTVDADNRFLSYYGQDRGAMITIDDSEFHSNSFCKGLIYYNKFQTIPYSEQPDFLNFTANAVGKNENQQNVASENFIRIKDSEFKNIGFHQVIQAVNLDSNNLMDANLAFTKISFNRFQDQGLILNTNGYSGSIEVSGSSFSKNIAYIQEILMTESLTADVIQDFSDREMVVKYSNDAQTSIKFKSCEDVEWTSNYLFQNAINPDTEFDDAYLVDMVENISAFVIKGNRGPMIFVNNTFSENIGTTGGVIHIESPDFRFGDNPYIVIKQNRFMNNMAYWAGNVFHIYMNVRMFSGLQGDSDSWQTCGAGILIEDNFFTHNVGLKRHNGGAGVLRCKHSINNRNKYGGEEDMFTYRSGKKRTLNSDQVESWLDDPSTHKSVVVDILNPSIEYEILTYGTLIKDNTFEKNYSGKRGTALFIENINELQLQSNSFKSNGPVHAYSEIAASPYYKNFLYNQRTLSFYLLGQELGNCIDEAAWFNRCYRPSYKIDMPQVQGAVYIKNCYDQGQCWFIDGDIDTTAELTVEQIVKFIKPWQSVQIKDNIFFNNQANIVMFETQQQPQASSLYIYGGTNTTISGNEFIGHRNWADTYIKIFAQDIYRYMPPNYFKYSQSAMIRIEYPYNVFANFFTALDNTESNQNAIETEISNNLISDNINIQVVTYIALEYKASILEWDCKVTKAVLSINDNEIIRNKFIGRKSTLFFINGGIASVNNNDFMYNGILTTTERSQSVANLEKEFSRSEFPWDDYSFTEAQEKGIFTFEFYYAEVPIYQAHSFSNNTFRHIYCQIGCAYHVTGTEIQQYSFTNNTYSFLISSQGAAVFYGKVDLLPSNQLAQVWTQSYRNETFDRIFGGSIQFSGLNVPVTFIENSKFINNFGSYGAAINFEYGGGLYISESNFQLDYQNEAIKQTLASSDRIDLTKLEDLMSQIVAEVIQEIFSSYDDRVKQSSIFDAESLDQTKLLNDYGQIYFQYTQNTVLNVNQPVFGFDNRIMSDLILDIWNLDLYSTSYSAIRDSLFKENIGLFASSIYLDNSSLSLVGTNDNINFEQNSAPQGPTIFATFSNIISSRMLFERNTGFQGGCYQIDSTSELIDFGSAYAKNTGTQGGVIFAISDSKFKLEQCNFDENQADEGAVLYASYNSLPQSLEFLSCQFERNTAGQNLIQLLFSNAYIEDSLFLDNSAIKVSHGFTLITSKLDFFNSTVNFSEGFADSLSLDKLDTAFFSLFLGSSIQIGRNTTISNLVALNQAVLSAYSLSSVNIHSGVNFINNTAISSSGQTISLQNTGDVNINDAYFDNNQQINILVELGQISVKNSKFTNGRANHIQGISSGLALDNVSIYDSSSQESSGHGVYCNRCQYIQIQNSNFTNLTSEQEGGAIMLQQLYNSTLHPVSYIRNNTFSDNISLQGGAIVLDRPNLLQVNNNIFSSNIARRTDGGAILYRCDLTTLEGKYECNVSLIDNTFEGNQAKRKGGALRYENANFTDISLISDNRRNLQQSSINNFFQRNKAAYGNDMASFPKSISYVVPENGSGANIDLSLQQLEIAAGQDFEFDMTILDQEGRIYTDENKAIAKIVFEPGQDLGPQALMLGSEAVAKEGKFSFNSFKVRIKPSTSAKITFQFVGLDHFGTPIEFLDNFPVFVVSARKCVQGEQYTEELSCEPCPQAFYLYEAQNEPGQCKACDQNSYCYGMNNTAPKPGYWRSQPTLEIFTACTRPESCLGGNDTDALGQCDTGYKGILCNDCDKGYSRSGKECSLCPGLFWNAVIFGLLMIGLLLAIMFIVRSTLGGVETTKPLHQVFLKIFMNHFQVLAAISQIDFKWPELIQSIISSQQGVADGPAKILSVDCLLMDIFPGGEPTMRLNYLRLIMFACMPFLIQIISFSFWQLYGRCARVNAQNRGDKSTATTIIVLFLFYPTIVQILAKSMNCIEIEGESRLFDDLEEVCYEGNHLLILLTVSFPGLLAWAIGIPVYALIKLAAQRDKLMEIKKFSEGTTQADDLLRRFKIRLGFLTAGYNEQYYYWEIILLMRKTVIVLMVVFLSQVSSGVQSLTSILVLSVFFMIHWTLQPYYDIALNQMETLSLFVIIITIYSGLYYQAAAGDPIMENQIVTWIIFSAVLLPSVVFGINFARKMWVEILKVVAGKSSVAFRYLTCGSVNLLVFKKEHMNEESDDEDLSDYEIKDKPTASRLVGFEVKQNQYQKKIKQGIMERRRAKKAALESEQEESSDYDNILLLSRKEEKIKAQQIAERAKAQAEAGEDYQEDVSSILDSSQVQMNLINEIEKTMNQARLADQQEFYQSNNSQSVSDNSSNLLVIAKSNIVQRDPGPFEQTQKRIKVQNFEYKDEIEFRNERVQGTQNNSKLIKKDSHQQHSAFEDDLTKTQTVQNLRYGAKKSGGKDVQFRNQESSMQKNSIFMNTSSFSVNEFKGMLETDDDKLKSRNNQNRIKSGLLKPAGLTAAILQERDDPSEIQRKEKGKNRQVQSQLNPATFAKLKKDEKIRSVKVEKKSENPNDDGDASIGVFEDDEAIGSEGSPGRKDITAAQFSNTNAASSTKFNNIFKKQQQVAKISTKPAPTKEQILVKPRLLFHKKRNPEQSARLTAGATSAVGSKPEKDSLNKGEAADHEEIEANLDDEGDHGDDFKVQKPQGDAMQGSSVSPMQSLMGNGKSMGNHDRKQGGLGAPASVFYKKQEQEQEGKSGEQDEAALIAEKKRRKNKNRKANKKAAANAEAAKNVSGIEPPVSKIKMIMGIAEKEFDSDDSLNFL